MCSLPAMELGYKHEKWVRIAQYPCARNGSYLEAIQLMDNSKCPATKYFWDKEVKNKTISGGCRNNHLREGESICKA